MSAPAARAKMVTRAAICSPARLRMSEPKNKGGFQADIPNDAVQEALRSVEKIARGEAPSDADAGSAGDADAPAIEVEPAPAGDGDGLAAQVKRLEAELDLSQTLGRETQEKLKAEHDRCLRVAADLENYKKRAAKEREEVQKFGAEKLLKDLLPVVDGLDRALAAAPADDPLSEGVKLVRATLERTLARHGVVGFTAMGEQFDPAFHEALMQVPTKDQPPGTVVVEHARGFKLNDRLVRPAMVGVAVEPPAAPPADPATPTET
ncbi:MAG: nucleotide exchange factor GrpE [Solirubrobacterales bacterium]